MNPTYISMKILRFFFDYQLNYPYFKFNYIIFNIFPFYSKLLILYKDKYLKL